MFNQLRQFWLKERGATAIEYALICALMVLAIAATLPTLGTSLYDVYRRIELAFS